MDEPEVRIEKQEVSAVSLDPPTRKPPSMTVTVYEPKAGKVVVVQEGGNAMMKVSDFLAMLMKAESVKTLYVMGGWGFPLNEANKKRAYTNPYNTRSDRKPLIEKASADTFAFDCCGVVRSVLWDWNGDASAKNGGAVYGANGVPEYDAKQFMFQGCTEQSSDFSKIEAGEFLWLDGHCGVYIGDGLAIESTPKWKDGVQITAVANIGKKEGYNSRTWTYHGHLKYVDYTPDVKYNVGETYNVLCNDDLMIREEPGTDAEIIGKLAHGDKITCKATKTVDGNIWMQGEKGWSCAVYNGKKLIDHLGWTKIDDKWYYYDQNGEMKVSFWTKYKGEYYYLGADGVMVTGWQRIQGERYFFYADGHMAQSEWIEDDTNKGKYIYLDMDGQDSYKFRGFWQSDSKGKWWTDENGCYPRSRSVRIGQKNYTFDAKGYLIG